MVEKKARGGSEADVEALRAARAAGERWSVLAQRFGVAESTLRRRLNKAERLRLERPAGSPVERLSRVLDAEIAAAEAALGAAEPQDADKRARLIAALARAAEKLADLRAQETGSGDMATRDDGPDLDALRAQILRRLDRLAERKGEGGVRARPDAAPSDDAD